VANERPAARRVTSLAWANDGTVRIERVYVAGSLGVMLESTSPMNQAPPPNLRITFPPPGFFLVDVRLAIAIDGYPVYDGSFKRGVDLAFPVAPGPHQITAQIDMGGISRNRAYPISIMPGRGYLLILEYSRLWGNFTSKPTIFER
jgi:hypothetical protein